MSISKNLQAAAEIAACGHLYLALESLGYPEIFEIQNGPRGARYSESLGADEYYIRPIAVIGEIEVYFYLFGNNPWMRVYVAVRNTRTEEEEEVYMDLSDLKMCKRPVLGLCKGRHDIPDILGYVFEEIEDPTDFLSMRFRAEKIISVWRAFQGPYPEGIRVRVTGLTAALVAVINACHKYNLPLVLEHYDRETGRYLEQNVETF